MKFHKEDALIGGFKRVSNSLNRFKSLRNSVLPPHPFLSSNERKPNPNSLMSALLKRSIDYSKKFASSDRLPNISS